MSKTDPRQLGHVPMLAVLAVLVGCSAPVSVDTLPAGQPASRSTAATTAAAALPTSSRNAAVPAAETHASPAGEAVTVVRVVDGDTLEISGGRTIRLLGIDSCEMDTPSGPEAKNEAESLVASGAPITMTAEPGVDLDRYGRLLRYVQLNGGRDFGEEMVKYDHTGIYDPANNDASRAYLDRLYAADLVHAANPPAGRDCGEPTPAVAPAPAPAPAPEPEPEPAASNCHASYDPCIPDGPDLDCGDLSHSVRVVGPDEYRLDRDKDGVGCE